MDLELNYIRLNDIYFKAEDIRGIKSFDKEKTNKPFGLELKIQNNIYTFYFKKEKERDINYNKIDKIVKSRFKSSKSYGMGFYNDNS